MKPRSSDPAHERGQGSIPGDTGPDALRASRLGSVLLGAWAALRSPLWLRRDRLSRLLEPPRGVTGGLPDPLAVRAAHALLRRLARIPASPWRNTCLYRSIAECLVLRRRGVAACVRLGVRREPAPHGAIAAHAWVAGGGATPDDGPREPFRRFRRAET